MNPLRTAAWFAAWGRIPGVHECLLNDKDPEVALSTMIAIVSASHMVLQAMAFACKKDPGHLFGDAELDRYALIAWHEYGEQAGLDPRKAPTWEKARPFVRMMLQDLCTAEGMRLVRRAGGTEAVA